MGVSALAKKLFILTNFLSSSTLRKSGWLVTFLQILFETGQSSKLLREKFPHVKTGQNMKMCFSCQSIVAIILSIDKGKYCQI